MFENQKDEKPSKTVQNIKNILSRYGISINEVQWNHVRFNCWSVRIEIKQSYGFGTCGKGISREYALASAYAELMERLHTFPIRIGGHCADSVEQSIPQCLRNKKIISMDNIRKSFLFKMSKEKKYVCVPFYHYNSRECVYLPYNKPFWNFIGSNGYCAGNTPQEAIIQGICEIFERFVLKELFMDASIRLPSVPYNLIKDLKSQKIISRIKQKGWNVIVKDCSLGGRFPVVGCLLINDQKTHYHFHLGSAPVFDTAIQRCLTETAQGLNNFPDDFYSKMKSIDSNEFLIGKDFSIDKGDLDHPNYFVEFYRNFKQGNGRYPNSVFYSKGFLSKKDLSAIFMQKPKSNVEMLKWLVSRFIKEKYDLFIRDTSSFGFPTFIVYIPYLSEITLEDVHELRSFLSNDFENVIRNIKLATKKDLKNFLNKCNQVILPFLRLDIVCSEQRRADVLFKLIRIAQYVKDYSNLIIYLRMYSEDCVDKRDKEYFTCLILLIKMISNNLSIEESQESLKNIYSGVILRKVIKDFLDSESAIKGFDEYRPKVAITEAANLISIAEKIRNIAIDQARLSAYF